MLNSKEEYSKKFSKDKLHKNNYLHKAKQSANQDFRIDKIRSSIFIQKNFDVERSQLENDLKKMSKLVLFNHYKYIANRIKDRDFYADKRKPIILLDYDFPLK